MTRRSKRKTASNKKKQATEEVQESPINSQSDEESQDQSKDECSASVEEDQTELEKDSSEQVLADEQQDESVADDEEDESVVADEQFDDKIQLEKTPSLEQEELVLSDEETGASEPKPTADVAIEEPLKDSPDLKKPADQDASESGGGAPEEMVCPETIGSETAAPDPTIEPEAHDQETAEDENHEDSPNGDIEMNGDAEDESRDQEMIVDDENQISESPGVDPSATEKSDTEDKAPDETAMETTEESKSTPEDESKDENDEAVIEIGTTDSSDGEKSEKEPVVIELGTNDDLSDETSSKNDSPQLSKPSDFQVLDEIDLTKSDDEDVDAEKEKELFEAKYVIPDYDDPDLTELDIDPECDGAGKVEESAEFRKYWVPVQDNPQEFTAWTYLLQFVEQNGNLPLARRAFNSFFGRYPLCYGYWKKFSELERKNGNILRAQKILERGVRAIPLSIDLWVHVTDFYINYYNRPDAGVEKTRKIFERAIAASGQEFRSEKLWNKFVKWEIENRNWMGIMGIYDKAIRTLTQHYSIIFSDFKSFVNKRSPRDILSEDEFQEYLKEVRKDLSAKALKKASEKRDDTKDGDCEVLECNDDDMDDAPPGVDAEEKPPTDEDLKAMRTRIINEKRKVYEETEQAVTKIWAFEEGIKRPYFHVKQLERAQLKNWREYLDFEIARENHDRIVLLFERCLIACALYEDFWLKYTKYMAKVDALATSQIFERACTIHLPKKPNIHIQWSAHEELQENIDKSSNILENLDRVLPGMAMIRMRRVAVARRSGQLKVAEDLLQSYVACAAKDKEEVFYTRKLSWFLLKIADKPEEAKKLMKDLIPKYKSELKIYNDLVEMEFQCAGEDYPGNAVEEGLAMEAFNLALSSEKLTDEQKFVFSQRKLEFLEDYGRDVKHLQKVYDEHQKLVRNQKKRTQIDLTTDENPSKKQKTESAAISVVGSSHLANGASYTTGTAAATTSYAVPQTAYAAGDPSSVYYQQQQNYWNYAQKPSDASAQSPYAYSQAWSQYYNAHR